MFQQTTVFPILLVENVASQIDFLVNVFGTEVTDAPTPDHGSIRHAEIRIGASTIMIDRAGVDFPARRGMNYISLHGVDSIHDEALRNGAEEIAPPQERPYGVRECGFTDPFGNQWWVAESLNSLPTLEATEHTWNRAIEENDAKKIAEFMSDTWCLYSGDGAATGKARFLEVVANGTLVHTAMDFEIVRTHVHGTSGIVVQRGTSTGTWQGAPFSNSEVAISLFEQSPTGWKAVLTVLVPK